MTILVTGGAGFIGSAVVRHLINDTEHRVIIVDKLTYAGNLESLPKNSSDARMKLEKADIRDANKMRQIFGAAQPDAVLHLAAESHVDRSITEPDAFIQTNVVGTYTLLEEALTYWRGLDSQKKKAFRFHHVSTDEVFGSLGKVGSFSEDTPYRPNSPYSASKAGSDHLVRAWHHTYGLPIVATQCSNNYGPYQFPEKLIPLTLIKALQGAPIPVYGKGDNVRDWLFVEDHVEALLLVLTHGMVGETYNIGGRNEKNNLETVQAVCKILDELLPDNRFVPYSKLITFVEDRPGHDFRYAIDSSKIERELQWHPKHSFEVGLRKTVAWYLENRGWWERVMDGTYRGERLGLLRETL